MKNLTYFFIIILSSFQFGFSQDRITKKDNNCEILNEMPIGGGYREYQIISVKGRDVKDGWYFEYYKNDKIGVIASYTNDKLDGEYNFYLATGKLAIHCYYSNGKLDGLRREYNYDGTLYCEKLYENGQISNSVEKIEYYIDRELYEIEHYKNGKLIYKESYEDIQEEKRQRKEESAEKHYQMMRKNRYQPSFFGPIGWYLTGLYPTSTSDYMSNTAAGLGIGIKFSSIFGRNFDLIYSSQYIIRFTRNLPENVSQSTLSSSIINICISPTFYNNKRSFYINSGLNGYILNTGYWNIKDNSGNESKYNAPSSETRLGVSFGAGVYIDAGGERKNNHLAFAFGLNYHQIFGNPNMSFLASEIAFYLW